MVMMSSLRIRSMQQASSGPAQIRLNVIGMVPVEVFVSDIKAKPMQQYCRDCADLEEVIEFVGCAERKYFSADASRRSMGH